MFLKKTFNLLIFSIFLSFPIKSDEVDLLNKALKYIENIDEFSSSFLQINNNDVSEGKIFIKGNRLRIEYTAPSKLVFVLKENKGMYYNTELQEVQYFNSKNTIGGFIIDFFNDESFLLDSNIVKGKGYFNIVKEIKLNEIVYEIKIYFEERPLQMRKLEILNELETITFTISNYNYNPNLNDKIFSLANPLLS